MSPLLATHLGSMYAADMLGRGRLADAKAAMITVLDSNADIKQEAVNEMQRLSSMPDGRCFVSKKHLEYLKSVLTQGD